jgi:hypothetical protein
MNDSGLYYSGYRVAFFFSTPSHMHTWLVLGEYVVGLVYSCPSTSTFYCCCCCWGEIPTCLFPFSISRYICLGRGTRLIWRQLKSRRSFSLINCIIVKRETCVELEWTVVGAKSYTEAFLVDFDVSLWHFASTAPRTDSANEPTSDSGLECQVTLYPVLLLMAPDALCTN